MTHTTKHTPVPLHNVTGDRPGPWIRQVLNDESEAYIHDKHCNAIARVYSLSDAALIAAAPAMYEALSQVQEFIKTLVDADVLAHPTKLTVTIAKALAQAEGGVR